MPIDGVNSSGYRDYLSYYISNGGNASVDAADGSSKAYNAVFEDKKNMGVSVDDFLSLMVAQLTNQDFMNPVDDTQYVTQLAQFATMQSMQDMSAYMKTNYVLSLIGQEVTAAKFTVAGALQKETGVIEKISLVDNEYAIYVNGVKFSLEQIMEYHTSTPKTDGSSDEDDKAKAISEMTLDEIWGYYQDKLEASKPKETNTDKGTDKVDETEKVDEVEETTPPEQVEQPEETGEESAAGEEEQP